MFVNAFNIIELILSDLLEKHNMGVITHRKLDLGLWFTSTSFGSSKCKKIQIWTKWRTRVVIAKIMGMIASGSLKTCGWSFFIEQQTVTNYTALKVISDIQGKWIWRMHIEHSCCVFGLVSTLGRLIDSIIFLISVSLTTASWTNVDDE